MPAILTAPSSQTVITGQSATFNVGASGTAPLSYQWRRSGINISGATAASYTTPATSTSDNGSTFDVVVSNSKGSVTSSTATLTVNATVVAPTITTHPASQTVAPGTTATFSVIAGGTAPLSYQWQRSGANINGATAASYTTPATSTSDNGSTFAVVVSNSKGSVTSNAATLTVNAAVVAPMITTQPANSTVTAGQTATFTVVASGTAPLSYQWQRNGANINGATAASYTTPATSTSDNGSTFAVVVSNSKGSVTSSTATLTVNATVVAPTITTHPASQTVAPGTTATFSVIAGGTAPLSYQWQRSGANINGATAASYTTPATSTSDNGSTFAVVVSNSKGSVTSNAARLTVNAAVVAPMITTQPANSTVTAGQTATFTVVASGTAPLSYQWQKNGTNISGATSPSYTTPATTTADKGSIFDVMISNSKGSVTSSTVALTVNAAAVAPTVTTQPAKLTAVTAGQTATFTVVASGTAPLSYQWQKNGANISGATAASYTTPATTTSDSGSTFAVVVSNPKGSVTSNSATLTVVAATVAPTITTQPARVTVNAGQTATFTVVASGTAPLSYQWQKNGTNISGATAASYTTPAATTSDNGSTFAVVVSNSKGSATSNTATLTVNAAGVAPTITVQPGQQTVTAGQTATFAVVASGTAPLSYQWQRNGANISGATAASYTTPATTTSDSGSTFDVVVSNSNGSVTSSAATLTVHAAVVAPMITTQPANSTVTAGQTATFTVVASGTAPLSYQWQKNGTNISGATGSSYTTPATTTSDNGSTFAVVVTNSAGSVTSNSAKLTVNPGTQHTYSTTFPLTENPISEGGNWVGGHAAGQNCPGANPGYCWGNVQTGGAMAYGADQPQQYGDATAILTGSWSPTQTATGVVKINTTPTDVTSNEISLRLRMSISSQSITGYEIYCSVMTSNPYCHIARWNGPYGSFCNIEPWPAPLVALVNGDTFKATISGTNPTTITAYRNGTQLMQATDTGQNCSPGGPAGPFTSGNPGIGYFQGLNHNWNYFGWSSFQAQDNIASATALALSHKTAAVLAVNKYGSVTSSSTQAVSSGTIDAAPTITNQPVSLSVVTGAYATFAVVASGSAPLSYQWQKNGTNISGATGSSYTTPATTTSDNGSAFAVVVSNSAGSVTSASATLTVKAGTQKTYSTTFPLTENPISEGGNWINGGTVGLDWSDGRTTPGLAFGTINSSIANYGDSTAVLTGVWNPDQMAQAVVYSVNQTSNIHEEVQLRLRTTITAHSITGYEVTFRCTSDGSQYLAIVRWNGALGDFTYIANLTPGGPGIHNGDTVKATIIGNTITAYINGTQVLQGTDATYTSGNPGIGFDTESPTGAAVDANFGFTSFSAADNQ